MNLSGVRAGDIVEADIKGRRFYAAVDVPRVRGCRVQLAVTPITPGISYRTLTSRQVIGHWRASSATRSRHSADRVEAQA